MELGDWRDESIETNWRAECARLHSELDKVRAECAEWKTKFERLMLWKEQPRLPVRGNTQAYTIMGHRAGDDGK